MNEPQVLVNATLIQHLRLLLIRLAQTDDRPPSERKVAIERHRQYCEGYLGVKRDELDSENRTAVDGVLVSTGVVDAKMLAPMPE
ncbi:hypothetical protein CMI47_21465 [Candidatus Pacearchaeota archaeon]|nr:hypothetical protein [Candidatus Pacearchaeota archaeon]|tara:strand:- start:1703 stop:1957 length:255 start_codon:yes stop_codon:yes gene_type:complete